MEILFPYSQENLVELKREKLLLTLDVAMTFVLSHDTSA